MLSMFSPSATVLNRSWREVARTRLAIALPFLLWRLRMLEEELAGRESDMAGTRRPGRDCQTALQSVLQPCSTALQLTT